MSRRPLIGQAACRQPRTFAWAHRLGAYIELTKARLVALVLITTVVGFLLGAGEPLRWELLAWTVIGTALAALGANAFNQVMERRLDRRMERTRRRPLPAGDLGTGEAAVMAVGMMIAGPALLAIFVNTLAAGLALAAALIYLAIYTPLKTRSPLCTLVGAICGALPPMVGWSATTGRLDAGAWVLGAVLFLWQIPHFLALAWLYREDYARGGFRMLPLLDRHGDVTTIVIILYSLALLPACLAATMAGLAGWAYAAASLLLGGGLVALALELRRRRTRTCARRVFLASILYLPLLLGFMVADRGPITNPVQLLGSDNRAADSAAVHPEQASPDDRLS